MIRIDEVFLVSITVFFAVGMAFLMLPSKKLYSNFDYEEKYNQTLQENKELQQKLDLCQNYTGNNNIFLVPSILLLMLLIGILLFQHYMRGKKC